MGGGSAGYKSKPFVRKEPPLLSMKIVCGYVWERSREKGASLHGLPDASTQRPKAAQRRSNCAVALGKPHSNSAF